MIELGRDGYGLWHLWEKSEIFGWESERKRIWEDLHADMRIVINIILKK